MADRELHRFDKFLDDEIVYKALERYWVQWFIALLDKMKIDSSDWVSPYYNTAFNNGKSMMDGNPIFSAKELTSERIIRVIQEESSDHNTFTCYENSTLDSITQNEFVIVCTLTEQNLGKTENAIIRWINME